MRQTDALFLFVSLSKFGLLFRCEAETTEN